MSTWGNIAGGYLQAMPRIDRRNQLALENERADLKQKMWLAQQKRIQDQYEQAQKERAANRMLLADPTKYRGLMGLEGPMRPENQEWMQSVQSGASPEMLLQMGQYQTPEEKDKRALMLKLAGQTPGKDKLQLTTIMKDGKPMRAIVNLNTGAESLLGQAPESKGIQIDNRQEDALAKGIGTLGSKILGDAYNAAQEAKVRVADLKKVLNNKSTLGGPFSDWILGAKQLLNKMGVSVDNLNEDEIAKALGNKFTVAARGGAFSGGKPLTGATSDKDIQLLQSAVPSLRQSPEGRKLLAQMLIDIEQSKVDFWSDMQGAYQQAGGKFDPLLYKPKPSDGKKLHEYAQKAERIAAKAPSNPTVTVNKNQKPGYAASLVKPFNKGGTTATAPAPASKPTHRKYDPRTGTFTVVR